MNPHKNLEYSIIHEFGHFCLDLILISINNTYDIKACKFLYFVVGDNLKGSVTCQSSEITRNSELILEKNHSELCLTILNLIAGVAFEEVYIYQLDGTMRDASTHLTMADSKDYNDLKQLLLEFDPADQYRRKLRRLLNEVLPELTRLLRSNPSFIIQIGGIAQPYLKKLISRYQAHSDFEFSLTQNEIGNLKEEILPLLVSEGLDSEILKIAKNVSIILKGKLIESL